MVNWSMKVSLVLDYIEREDYSCVQHNKQYVSQVSRREKNSCRKETLPQSDKNG